MLIKIFKYEKIYIVNIFVDKSLYLQCKKRQVLLYEQINLQIGERKKRWGIALDNILNL